MAEVITKRSSKKEILEAIASGALTQAQVQELMTQPEKTLSVSAKTGAVSLYGVRTRFPITMYPSEWRAVLARKDEVLAFLDAHPEAAQERKPRAKKGTSTTPAETPAPAAEGSEVAA